MIRWSPCSRFVAVALRGTIEIRDAATLERLHIFTPPSPGKTRWLSFSPDSRSLTWFNDDAGLITWDLQTGGQISATSQTADTPLLYFSSAYSMDGKFVGVVYEDLSGIVISTYNHLSGTLIYSHRVSEGQFIAPIWTRGEFLRFAAMKPGSISIWEVGFTSEHTLAEIESLPAPDDIDPYNCLFLPTRTRLAYILDNKAVLIWDARDSGILLNFVGGNRPRGLSFSSDGHFFAFGTEGGEIHLWEESPIGYVLHRKLASDFGLDLLPEPFLSPDGKSIITFEGSGTQLWHTTDPITPLSIVPTQPDLPSEFILEFSPDRSLAAAARIGYNTATIIDLKSGDPRLIIDTGMEVFGLGVTASAIVVVGGWKIITWDVPAGDCVLDAKATIHNSARTIVINHPAPSSGSLSRASISPNFDYVVTTRGPESLDAYDVPTGKHLGSTTIVNGCVPWFTRDGCKVWSLMGVSTEGWKIIKGGKSDIIELEPLGSNADPSGGCPWQSPCDHNVTDDGWILDSRKKRVMWLPHRWRVREQSRIWDGRFLGLIGGELPGPIIIELDE